MTNDRKLGEASERHLPTRPSRLVDRSNFPRIAAREKLVARLRVHDTYDEKLSEFSPEEFDLLRQISLEVSAADPDPWIRRHAIAILGTQPNPENLNALSLVARVSPDASVRSEALLALGRSGVAMAAPVLAEGLAAADSLEVASATRALQELGDRIGTEQILAAVRDPSARAVAELMLRRRPARRRKGHQATKGDMPADQ